MFTACPVTVRTFARVYRAVRRPSSPSVSCSISTRLSCPQIWIACGGRPVDSCCSPATTKARNNRSRIHSAVSPGRTCGGGSSLPMPVSLLTTGDNALMSTQSDRQPVFLEFPNFGYGPASTLLTLARAFADRFDWHIVSTGGAAEFLRVQLPGAVVHELDTFTAAAWPAFLDIAEPGSLIISCTNPEFAAW